ncbi:gamma-glutamyl-gamma-aminobutyrate hydrolase [Brachybacterium endophyticum]|uniref:Gamma-glutamyl-gamma-aminobutyrate hydrolase n=1 Tax=Brachybacterium endophyticum TaxID=2182385 RepID=A0A2U2RM05_9MICO|nr:type 1 glutamine amidotransferase [Brachybacterium endophyticum]PWH06898.1 gamma-glutamyl-gamma-aminobutyrate hydrolase [Brachybacterium endophyticum]
MAERTRRPLIGVTAGTSTLMSGAWEGHEAVVLTEHYVAAIRRAGARPVILAPQDEWTDEELAELDGIVLSGGADLDPAGYGAPVRATDMTPAPERDAFETSLYRAARRVGLPVLGICRGLQIITVAEGGDLHQHLPEDLPAHPRTGERPTRVEVDVEAASDVALAVGTQPEVTAFHHQGARNVGAGLRVVGRHASGLPLALEAVDGAPVLAVQWHPELDREQDGLFEALVTAIHALPARADGGALV